MVIGLLVISSIILYLIFKTPEKKQKKEVEVMKEEIDTSLLRKLQEMRLKTERETEVSYYPLMMKYEHEVEYINTGKKYLIDEYKKLNIKKRNEIYFAILRHPNNYQNSSSTQHYYSTLGYEIADKMNYWINIYHCLNDEVVQSGYEQFKTLSEVEKKEINTFVNLYAGTYKLKDSGEIKELFEKRMFESNIELANDFFDYPEGSQDAVFEVLLLASIHTLRIIENIRENVYPKFEKEYIIQLFMYAQINGLSSRLPANLEDFVYKRLGLYGSELNGLVNSTDGSFLPLKTAFNFYEEPLRPVSEDCLNLETVFKTGQKVRYLIDGIDDSILTLVNRLKF